MHLLPPLSHKLLLCLGHADHLGDRVGKPFTHTQRLPPQFLLLPNTLLPVLADKRVFAVNGCALVCFLLLPIFCFRKTKNPQNEIED